MAITAKTLTHTPPPLFAYNLKIGQKELRIIRITILVIACLTIAVGLFSLLNTTHIFFYSPHSLGFNGSIGLLSTGVFLGVGSLIYAMISREKQPNEVLQESRKSLKDAPTASAESMEAVKAKKVISESHPFNYLHTLPPIVDKQIKISKGDQFELSIVLENALKVLNTEDYQVLAKHPEIQLLCGGRNTVFTLKSYPQYVFKFKKELKLEESESYADEYLRMTLHGQSICEKERLNLIIVPPATKIRLKNRWLIVQKREDIEGGYEYQKGLYKTYFEDSKLKTYTLNLSKQLALFILLMKMKDVKYDNIPLTRKGYVAIIDLDQAAKEPMEGFYTSLAFDPREDGLMHIIPLDYVSEVANFLKNATTEFNTQIFEKRLDELKRFAVSREEIRRSYSSYLSEHKISSPKQTINVERLKKIAGKQKEIQKIAAHIINYLNAILESDQDNLDTQVGREKYLDIEDFYKYIEEDLNISNFDLFNNYVLNALELLKNDTQQIFNYEIVKSANACEEINGVYFIRC